MATTDGLAPGTISVQAARDTAGGLFRLRGIH
jgi:hypothetical protein